MLDKLRGNGIRKEGVRKRKNIKNDTEYSNHVSLLENEKYA